MFGIAAVDDAVQIASIVEKYLDRKRRGLTFPARPAYRQHTAMKTARPDATAAIIPVSMRMILESAVSMADIIEQKSSKRDKVNDYLDDGHEEL